MNQFLSISQKGSWHAIHSSTGSSMACLHTYCYARTVHTGRSPPPPPTSLCHKINGVGLSVPKYWIVLVWDSISLTSVESTRYQCSTWEGNHFVIFAIPKILVGLLSSIVACWFNYTCPVDSRIMIALGVSKSKKRKRPTITAAAIGLLV